MISREELDRLKKMAAEYFTPSSPRAGHETVALYGRLEEAVMQNIDGLLEAADLCANAEAIAAVHISRAEAAEARLAEAEEVFEALIRIRNARRRQS